MALDEDHLAIEIDDDAAPAAPQDAQVDLKADKADDAPLKIDADEGKSADQLAAETAAADLRRQLEEERSARREEARRRAEAEARADAERQSGDDGRYGQIVNAIQLRNTQLEQAQAALEKSIELGDGKTAAQAQVAISRIINEIYTLENGKRELDARRPSAEGRIEAQPQRRSETPTDPVEAFLQTVPDESARSWLRQHPECITDPRKRARMLAAHHEADADGIEISSPDYYAHLETKLGFRTKEARPEMKPEPKAAPAAPASRDRASGGRVTVRLSPEEQEAAQISGVTYEEYARNKLAMIKAGQLKG